MLPGTHAFLIDRALDAVGDPMLSGFRTAIQAGCADEDVWQVPLTGWRLQSPGLSHTYRPGRRRGELGAPSARTRIEGEVDQARRLWSRAPQDGAHHLGRALHLLGDVAVPARVHGVWHPLGDPYERWVEDHLDELDALPTAPPIALTTLARLIDELARVAAQHVADTTRSPWGALAHRLGRSAVLVDDALAARQARAVLPMALAYHVGFLRLVRPQLAVRTGSR